MRFDTQAPGTGAAEESVSGSYEDEASGGATAAAPGAAADDKDDDCDSKFGHRAAGKECEEHRAERPGRARWMGPLAGLLETAGKKISRTYAKANAAANPTVGGVAEVRQELLKLEESMGNLCSPHREPFRAKVEADCNLRGIGTVTLHIEIVEVSTRDLLALREELSVAVTHYARPIRLRNGRTESYFIMLEKPAVSASTGKVSLELFGDPSACHFRIKADPKDSTDRGGEQGEPKKNAALRAGSRSSGFSANDLVDPGRTVQATVGDAATPAASGVVTAVTSEGTKNEALEETGSPKGAPQALHKGDINLSLQGRP
ncbi:hypothetical protein, conserved [Eimeria necatrix]|uniref:Uncharacterized protein n=1 Tax=Eimeria necatrix TaxID=51315 RepID=U6MWP3_9EIME|nr:hypothetical protein, conserved [Eimeria necatrix]CDJ66919.1 hypothetical protein, conserved [Eimeria necatrix]